jgi:hypothetical protein
MRARAVGVTDQEPSILNPSSFHNWGTPKRAGDRSHALPSHKTPQFGITISAEAQSWADFFAQQSSAAMQIKDLIGVRMADRLRVW